MNKVILKFKSVDEQTHGPVKRIVGMMDGRSVVPLISQVELSANPRSAKRGSITADIQKSINEDSELFPFMTKGILLGTAMYRGLDRNRYELTITDPEIEGVLDGGHNMLAIGLQILEMAGVDERTLRKQKTWDDFKSLWAEYSGQIEQVKDDVEFVLPVEIVVPADLGDEEVVAQFRTSLLDICGARNNNAQLTEETKANKRGFYDELKAVVPDELVSKIEWKTNDGGTIKSRDLVSLAWIPLSTISLPGKIGVTPNQIYRNKAVCVDAYSRMMSLPSITEAACDGYSHTLHNDAVRGALGIAGSLPALYDKLFAAFPRAYNDAGGSYGKIEAVRMYDKAKVGEGKPRYLRRRPLTPWFGKEVDYTCPDGFLVPLVYGLKALIHEEAGIPVWSMDPSEFLNRHLGEIMKSYRLVLEMAGFDPQKVGKNISAYQFAVAAFQAEMAKEKMRT